MNLEYEHIVLHRMEDPVVEAQGQPVDSLYCETFWLPTIGPTCMWLLRLAARATEHGPYVVEPEVLGKCLGLGGTSPLARALDRLERFGCARRMDNAFLLRAHLGPLPRLSVERLPEMLQLQHAELMRMAA